MDCTTSYSYSTSPFVRAAIRAHGIGLRQLLEVVSDSQVHVRFQAGLVFRITSAFRKRVAIPDPDARFEVKALAQVPPDAQGGNDGVVAHHRSVASIEQSKLRMIAGLDGDKAATVSVDWF